jgi:hypothetical protein
MPKLTAKFSTRNGTASARPDFCFQPQPFEHGKVAGQADGDGRENNVKGYGKGKLYPRKMKSI